MPNKAEVIYRNLLLSVFAGKKDQAFKILNIWLQVSKSSGKIYLLFDPRLEALTSDRRWAALAVKKDRESYRTQKKPLLAYQLDSLGAEDQKCRTLKHYVENLHSYRAAIDSTDRRFDVHYFPDTTDHLCAARDEKHCQALQKLIGYKEWPRISEVGARPAKTVFLIVAHSDSTDIVHYLPLLKQSCTEGEAEWLYYATLYDRLQVMRGLPQRFGTQYQPAQSASKNLQLFPLEDAGKVNQWREELGMEPIRD